MLNNRAMLSRLGAAAALLLSLGCGSDVQYVTGSTSTISTSPTTSNPNPPPPPSSGAQPPGPPSGAPSGGGPGVVLALNKIFLGDTNYDGAPSPSAWKQYGYNIDGKISSKTATDLCKPAKGAAPSAIYPDGNGGIDNAHGKLLLPIIMGLAQDATAQINENIANGNGTFLLRVDGLGGGPSAVDLSARWYASAPTNAPLAVDGSAVLAVTAESLSQPGDIDAAKSSFFGSYVNNYVVVAAPPTTVVLRLAAASLPMTFTVHQAVITFESDPSFSKGSYGVIAGVLETEEYVEMMRQIAGSFDPALCSGTTFESLADQIRQASDIMVDGSQDPNQICNGVSFGMGFEAVAAKIGGVAPAMPPPPKPCQ